MSENVWIHVHQCFMRRVGARIVRTWPVGHPSVTLDISVPPLELSLDITPRGRLDVIDVRAQAAAQYGDVFDQYNRCLYCSLHTTAGYLPQSFAARLGSGPQG